MYIRIALEPPTGGAPRADDALRRLLRPGATIEGIVDRRDGRSALRVGRLWLPLATTTPLHTGDRLRLRVAAAEGEPRLEILSRDPAPLQRHIHLARHLLPRQGDIAAPFRIAAQSRTLGAPGASPSPRSSDLLLPLLQWLPEPQELARPDRLRQILRDSGVLYEWLLARAPHAAARISAGDLKATLLRLAGRLRSDNSPQAPGMGDSAAAAPSTPHGLGEAVEGALSRLRLLQLHNARNDGALDLVFEIPLRDGGETDRIELRLREDRSRQDRQADTGTPFEVTARFRFGAEDALTARVIFMEPTLRVTWWATTASLRRQVQAALPRLSARLDAAGLAVGSLTCREDDPPSVTDRPDGELIDDSV